MINLFTNYYLDGNNERQTELVNCVVANEANVNINKVYLVVDKQYELDFIDSKKILQLDLGRRPTYSDFFQLMNEFNDRNDVGILSNSDMYFDETVQLANGMSHNDAYALSRWDREGRNQHFTLTPAAVCSQDSWIFKGPIKDFYSDFFLGRCGCDNRIAYEIKNAGYNLVNPSQSIRSFHLHKSNIRHYDRRRKSENIPEPHLTIGASTL